MKIAAILLPLFAARGAVLDRLAVTVDQRVITLSDIDTDLRVDAFLDRKPVDLSPEARRKTADRLVDQILMLDEAAESHFALPSAADAGKIVDQVKSQYASAAEYQAGLVQYGIREADLTEHLLNGLRALRFADLRFRPEIQISEKDLRDRYDTLTAEWVRTHPGQTAPSFESSRTDIEKLIADERTMKSLDDWLAATRAQRKIEYREAAFQ